MIKALFFDLDGTLLNSIKRIPPKTIAALKTCRQNGIKVFAATSRPPLLMRMLRLTPDEEYVLSDGGIFYNGGCIYAGGHKQYTFLQEHVAQKSIDVITGHAEADFAIQMRDEVHSFRYPLPEDQYQNWGISRIAAFGGCSYAEVVKLVIFTPWDLLPAMRGELEEAVGDGANVYLTGSNDFMSVEVVDKNINKRLAVERVLQLCGFSRDEAAVFGDDHNDIEMLRGFRHSFAMASACQEARESAHHVIPGNDEEGICYALESILNLV